MEANELRIGNFVYFKHCDYDKTIPRIINYTCKPNLVGLEKVSVNRIEYNNIEPIQLTEDWLINLGFEKIREYFTIDNELDIFVNESGFYTHINCGNIILSSVHQLQNLYFALNNKELTHQKIIT